MELVRIYNQVSLKLSIFLRAQLQRIPWYSTTDENLFTGNVLFFQATRFMCTIYVNTYNIIPQK